MIEIRYMINYVDQRKCVQGYHNYVLVLEDLPSRTIARGKLDRDRMFPRSFKNIFSFKLAMFGHFNFVFEEARTHKW